MKNLPSTYPMRTPFSIITSRVITLGTVLFCDVSVYCTSVAHIYASDIMA